MRDPFLLCTSSIWNISHNLDAWVGALRGLSVIFPCRTIIILFHLPKALANRREKNKVAGTAVTSSSAITGSEWNNETIMKKRSWLLTWLNHTGLDRQYSWNNLFSSRNTHFYDYTVVIILRFRLLLFRMKSWVHPHISYILNDEWNTASRNILCWHGQTSLIKKKDTFDHSLSVDV